MNGAPTLIVTALVVGATAALVQGALLEGGQTIAAGQPVSASQQAVYATNVIDGRLGNHYTGGEWTDISDGAYVTIDLGRLYRLSDFNLLNGYNSDGLRRTSNFVARVSTNGAFAGEEVVLTSAVVQAKSLGFQDFALPAFGDSTNNPSLVCRHFRLTAATHIPGDYGPGITEILLRGIPDRGTGALETQGVVNAYVPAKAYTRTVWLTDTPPASYTLRLITPTSASTVKSLGRPVSVMGGVIQGTGSTVVDGINNSTGQEFLWDGGRTNDLSCGSVTVDLGEEMLIDRIDLLNTYNFNDRGTSNYLLRVSNDPAFAEGNNTDLLLDTFSALNQTRTNVLSQPALGRYVRFVAVGIIGFSPGLDEMSVYARTLLPTDLATGASQVGSSTAWGKIPLTSSLAPGTNYWMALTVTTAGGWSSTTLQSVWLVRPRGTLVEVR